ncbi:MAG: ADP-ribosylation factor-directed GTPase activating protein isoform b [Pirellulales bacterium]
MLLATAGCSDEPAPASQHPPAETAAALPNDEQLRATIDEVIDFTFEDRLLTSEVHAAWQILHGVLAYGKRFEIGHEDQRVPALDWVLDGGNMNGWVMRPGSVGLRAVVEPGSNTGQGHEDQWLAITSQADVSLDRTIRVGEQTFTMADLVAQAKHDIFEGKEASWTLIGLSRYLPVDETWTAADGQQWSLERIIAMEAEQDLNSSACGGSHRLIGLTMALAKYREQHPEAELSGGWLASHDRIEAAIETARRFQQPSGAFSVNYFARASNSPDLSAHLGATGHTLEFLSLALDDQRLREPWVTRAVVNLCELLQNTRGVDLECGALYHAVHGLVLYRQRRFGPREDAAVGATAGLSSSTQVL